jgi:hypothetical protein
MRPEEFTIAKEKRVRTQGASVITADPNTIIKRGVPAAAPLQPEGAEVTEGAEAGAAVVAAPGGEDKAYKPKVGLRFNSAVG